MATKTYYGDFNGTSAGSGLSYWIDNYDPIPSNAIITSITYTLRITASKYSSSWNWQLKHFYIGNGSPAASEKTKSMSSTEYTFSGSLTPAADGLDEFSSSGFYVYARANNSASSSQSKSYMWDFSITVEYSTPSVSRPTGLTIKQNTDDATFTLDWNDCSGTGGSGSIVYGVYDDIDYEYIRHIDNNPVTKSEYVGNIPEYNTTRKYSVIAKYSGKYSSWSDVVSITFYKPSINNPYSLTINQISGTSCTLSWQAASLNYTTGNITYSILKNNVVIKTTTDTSYTFNENETSQWGTQQVELTVKASASITGNTASGGTLNSDATNAVVFTFIPPYKTILRYSGNGPINGYEECIVYYYTGDPNKGINGWEECEVYRYTGESNATINGWQLCSYT